MSGTVGSGKTSVASAVGDLLEAAAVPYAVIDLDWLRHSWPNPPDDRFNLSIELANLATVSSTYLRAGAHRLVLAGVIERQGDRRRYEAVCAGIPLRVCRLDVGLDAVHRRLRDRHRDDPSDLTWHLSRSGELDAILRRHQVEDFVVDASYHTVREVAAHVLAATGWLATCAPPTAP